MGITRAPKNEAPAAPETEEVPRGTGEVQAEVTEDSTAVAEVRKNPCEVEWFEIRYAVKLSAEYQSVEYGEGVRITTNGATAQEMGDKYNATRKLLLNRVNDIGNKKLEGVLAHLNRGGNAR